MKAFVSLLLLSFTVSVSLRAQELDSIRFNVSAAPEWTNLFNRTDGWFGGDGIYSIALNGKESSPSEAKKTLFIFSDSMIGKVSGGKMEPNAVMIHNAVAVLDGNKPDPNKISFSWKKVSQKPESVCCSNQCAQKVR